MFIKSCAGQGNILVVADGSLVHTCLGRSSGTLFSTSAHEAQKIDLLLSVLPIPNEFP